MNTSRYHLRNTLSLVALALGLVGQINQGGADVLFVSNGDRRGFTRPDSIQMFDSVTLVDLGVFANTGLSNPQSLVFDPAGNLFVANWGNSTISKITGEGVVSLFANTGSGPRGLVFDKAGNLYVANYWTNTIEKYTPDGTRSLFAGIGMQSPTGLAIDKSDNVYVANAGNLTIRKFTPQGIGSLFKTTGQFTRPYFGLACDDSGNLYLGCHATNQAGILKFTPSGTQSLFHHSYLSWAHEMAFDRAGLLYVPNYGSDTIMKLSSNGVILASVVTSNSPFGVAIRPPCRITCPTNLVVNADAGQCGAVVHFTGAIAKNCTGLTITSVPPPGSYFPIGTNTVTSTARDATGQIEDTCAFQIIVQDGEFPVIHGLSSTPNVLWPPNQKMRQIQLNVTATDNCELVDCKIISVTSNEPVTGPGRADTDVDWQITGDLNLNLRAARFGKGTGRIYTITIQCTDQAGNISTAETHVTVPHS